MRIATKRAVNFGKVELQVGQVHSTNVSKKPTFETSMCSEMIGLMAALKDWNTLRDSMSEEDWARRLNAALSEAN